MSASVQFKQHPSSTWTTCRRPLLHHIYAPACCSGQIFLHRHFLQPLFWICRVQLLPQGCGGGLAHSLLHLILRVCWNQYQVKHLLLGLIVSRFGCLILLLASPANVLLYRHFLHAQFSGFLTLHSKMKTKGEVFHVNSYFSPSSFAGMYTPRHSVLEGRWQFPFPVLRTKNPGW